MQNSCTFATSLTIKKSFKMRTKKVFHKSEIAHVWANMQQKEARTTTNNFSFYGPNLYSYGTIIGTIKTSPAGSRFYVLNNRCYSRTTSEQQSFMRYAIDRDLYFVVDQKYYNDHNTLRCEIENLIISLVKAKKPVLYLSQMDSIKRDIDIFAVWYKKEFKKSLFAQIECKDLKDIYKTLNTYLCASDINEAIKAEQQRQLKEIKKQTAKQVSDAKKAIKKFLTYESDYISTGYSETAYCRISLDKTKIETSQGANVPIQEAKVLFSLIQAGKEIKDFNIGGYIVHGLNGVLTVGCYKIDKQNMFSVGKKLITL